MTEQLKKKQKMEEKVEDPDLIEFCNFTFNEIKDREEQCEPIPSGEIEFRFQGKYCCLPVYIKENKVKMYLVDLLKLGYISKKHWKR